MSSVIDVVGSFGGLSRSLKWDYDVGSRALILVAPKCIRIRESSRQSTTQDAHHIQPHG